MSQTTSLTSFMQQLQTLNDEYKKITKEIEHQDELIRAIQDQISSKQHVQLTLHSSIFSN